MNKEIADSVKNLPSEARVYFFYDERDQLIYIGKSINIKKRVQQHFSSRDRKSQKIQLFTKRVVCEVMGSELIALLHESDLIKKYQPIYNRSQRRSIYQYGLYLRDCDGYKGLSIEKTKPDQEAITSFSTMREAKQALFRITEKYHLCQKINGLYKTSSSCFQFQLKECYGACINKEAPEFYNSRLESFLSKTSFQNFTQLFEVSGRTNEEKGVVYIENGVYKGFGFCPADTEKALQVDYIQPRADNRDVRRILMRHLINL